MPCRAKDFYEAIAPMIGDSGACVSDDDSLNDETFLPDLNRAVALLLKRIDAKGTLWFWEVTASAGCFPCPPDCYSIRQAWLDGRTLEQKDEFFEGKLSVGLQDPCCSWNKNHIGRFTGDQVIDVGEWPTALPWPQHKNTRLAMIAEDNADAGAEVEVRYKDVYGNEQAETITLQGDAQIALTALEVSDITYLQKSVTHGRVLLQVYYSANERRLPFGACEPWQTIPTFLRKKLIACPNGCGRLLIKGKRRFIPAHTGDDLIQICDEEALSWSVQALAAQRRKAPDEYNAFLAQAINALEKELQNAQSRASVAQMTYKSPFGRSLATRCWN